MRADKVVVVPVPVWLLRRICKRHDDDVTLGIYASRARNGRLTRLGIADSPSEARRLAKNMRQRQQREIMKRQKARSE